MNFQEYLKSINACELAQEWAKDKTSTEAWEQCDRCDWLCWWYWKQGNWDLLSFVQVAKELANFVQKYRNITCVDAADAYAADYAAYAADCAEAAYACAEAVYAADADNADKTVLANIVRFHLKQPWRESDAA